MRVTGIDHVVLRVRDVEASAAWYRSKLGLVVERLDEWRRGQAAFVSLRVDASTIVDLLEGEPAGDNVDHVAFVVDEADLAAIAASDGWDVELGPMELSGAQGTGTGIYVRDPDGHRVELRTYP